MTKHHWTPDAVHELVKDWPDEARAERLQYCGPDTGKAYDWAVRTGVRGEGWGPLPPDLAAAAHVASGLDWLIGQGRMLDAIAVVLDTRDTLHAVSAAIMAAGGGSQ